MKESVELSRDDVLRRMLKTPPKPHAPLKAEVKNKKKTSRKQRIAAEDEKAKRNRAKSE